MSAEVTGVIYPLGLIRVTIPNAVGWFHASAECVAASLVEQASTAWNGYPAIQRACIRVATVQTTGVRVRTVDPSARIRPLSLLERQGKYTIVGAATEGPARLGR